ncbi:MAG: V-type ATP synthase subunit F [Candidatus Brocadiales bacterium]|jgi:vacuolar-type H+-ATPase subunit F/Vma7|nr:V-type ATP synthase subunit F [Candidatus Brocadiales bacterium]
MLLEKGSGRPMYNAVVIGEEDKILPFRALGLGLEIAGSRSELERALNKTIQVPQVFLIIVSEDIARGSLDIIAASRSKARVPILVLPSHFGSYGTSILETSSMIKRAVGIDILQGGQGWQKEL